VDGAAVQDVAAVAAVQRVVPAQPAGCQRRHRTGAGGRAATVTGRRGENGRLRASAVMSVCQARTVAAIAKPATVKVTGLIPSKQCLEAGDVPPVTTSPRR